MKRNSHKIKEPRKIALQYAHMPTCERNVADNMLLTLRTRMSLVLQLTATCLLLATFAQAAHSHVQPTVAAPAHTAALTASAPTTADGAVIGAKSLAAAAGAAAAMMSNLSLAEARNSHTLTVAVDAAAEAESKVAAASNGNNGNRNDELITSSANLLLADVQPTTTGHIVNLTRNHEGDVFRTNGVTRCNADTCVGLSSGTAALLRTGAIPPPNGKLPLIGATGALSASSGLLKLSAKSSKSVENCECRCLPYLSTYREDLGICVDDVHECALSPFVSGSSSEKIPFVFLPLRGQIIYPSREISFPDIRTPVCAVTGAQYMTTNGWSDLRNPIDTDYPFRMFRDEGRTFLQWLGEPDLRQKMQGRLIVVHLVCRDMTLMLNSTSKEHLLPPKNVFSPCVAFRVNGSPVKYFHNVSEVLFQSETTSTLASTSDGMTTKEYVVIGVCSLLLGLIYVASVFLYLHMKKRKSRDQQHMRNSLDDLANEINYPKNDQVTFGAPFNRSGSIYSATSLTTSNEPRSRASIGSLKEEMGIVKNNPLLQHFPQLGDHHSGFASDISNSNSECEMDGGGGGGVGGSSGGGGGGGASFHDKLKQLQTSALVHPQMNGLSVGSGSGSGSGNSSGNGNGNGGGGGSPNSLHSNANGKCVGGDGDEEPIEPSTSPTQENECLPVENVSIVEDMMTEEKLENLRAMVNGNVRKKLYFNPAYFEPHLLAQPPPAAVEFLHKIREVIAIAKYKMATKRYQPSLIMIPEEGHLRSSTPSLYGAQVQTTVECQGCVNNRCSGHVKNCGDKRNSIEKWLQSVQTREEEEQAAAAAAASSQKLQKSGLTAAQARQSQALKGSKDEKSRVRLEASSTQQTNVSLPRREITPPKQRPPPPPTSPLKPGSSSSSQSSRSVIEVARSDYRLQVNASKSEQHYRSKVSTSNAHPSVKIPISGNYDSFSALSAAAHMYGFAEMGSEIYNNPKFTLHDSPAASQRSHGSSGRSKNSRKRLDELVQYVGSSTPTSLTSAERLHYDMLRNMTPHDPCSVNGGNGAEGGCATVCGGDPNGTLRSNGSFHLDIPTPDYDSTMEKKFKEVYNSTQSSGAPSVPTPDYSTLSRKSLKQGQPPDSPIYRRKSPQYLIVDYETDSLERLEVTKRKSSQSSSSPSSDVSSQLSPSLSTALPLEEELMISHTVFNKTDGFRKEGEMKKKLSHKAVDVEHKEKDLAARIKYDTPFRGSMTIEVEHEPPSDMERSTDSDQFEPDTLERKFKKHSFCDISPWQQQQQQLQQLQQQRSLWHSAQAPRSLSSLPDMSRSQQEDVKSAPFLLRPSNSFRSPPPPPTADSATCKTPTYESHVQLRVQQLQVSEADDAVIETRSSFNCLRERYQLPPADQSSSQSCKCGGQARLQLQQCHEEQLGEEQGRLLTLEAKHTRRQRLMDSPSPPATVVAITKVSNNKTTIKISTPKVERANKVTNMQHSGEQAAIVEPQMQRKSQNVSPPAQQKAPTTMAVKSLKANYEAIKMGAHDNNSATATTKEDCSLQRTSSKALPKRGMRASPPPPPPPPVQATSESNTLASQKSHASSKHSGHLTKQPTSAVRLHPHYQNQNQYMQRSTGTEEDTMSNHSESTEFTGVSDTIANGSEFGGSCNNTMSSVAPKTSELKDVTSDTVDSRSSTIRGKMSSGKQIDSPQFIKKKLPPEPDYSAMFNTQINGLRNDYSLTKYMNRRKTLTQDEEQPNYNDSDSQREANNNNNNTGGGGVGLKCAEQDLSISSRSNRSSGRLSDRTKELYRNAGVPVGIAYPQRSTANGVNTTAATVTAVNVVGASVTSNASNTPNVQTVYRCEIEPIQLTHGMQIAMGLKDRAKKAKDLKNAWRKFVSMAASKFSPTQSPAPPYDKKTQSFLEILDRDEGISSLIDEQPQVSTPKSSYSAPASQNYYEQRFGARPQEMDSGYMSADSGEVYKRSFYDRYNFRLMSGREHVIRVDTIEDNSDGGGAGGGDNNSRASASRRNSLVDSNRFEDFEHLGEPPPHELVRANEDHSDADSDKTLTHSIQGRSSGSRSRSRSCSRRTGELSAYSSEDEQPKSASYGSSETDGETNAEDMWESGAESIETHSVLYKNVRQY